MYTCPNCGAECVPGAAVCLRCGAALPVPPPVQPPVPPPGAYPHTPQFQPQPFQPAMPPRPMLPAPQYVRPQRSFNWRDIFTVLGFVSSVVGYFFASVLLLPLGLIASIVGFPSERNRGLAVAGIVISAIGALIKVMVILSESALLPEWFTSGVW